VEPTLTDAVIYIPTWKRVHRQITWQWISPEWRERTFLVAHPSEVEALEMLGYPVLATPTHVDTIGVKRQWIFDQHTGSPYAVILDDDLSFAVRRVDEPTKFVNIKNVPGEFDRMMLGLLDLFTVAPLVGIRNRSGANRDHEPAALRNRRQHDVIGVDVEVMRQHDFRLDRTGLMEDFDFVLQFLTAGYSNLLLNTHTEDDSGRDGEGGCADERDLARQDAAARWLAAQWPDYVTVVQKETKGGGDWSVRSDVRVQWAKAAKAGQQA
jgi:hypothetical protein